MSTVELPVLYVWIKLAIASDDAFVKVDAPHGSDVSDVARLACNKFPRWGVDSGQVRIYRVAKGGEPRPSQATIAEALKNSEPLSEDEKLESTAVTPTAWLVAVCSPGARAHPAAGPPLADVLALFSTHYPMPLDEHQRQALRFSPAFEEERAALRAGDFNDRCVTAALRKLQNLVASTTRLRLATKSGIMLGEPVHGAVGQAGTSILYAFLDGLAKCAKVGPHAALLREWNVSQTIHAHCAAPTVIKALHFDAVPGKYMQGLLLMPLYPMSAGAALLAMIPEHTATAQRIRCRDTLAALAALCGLSGIAAFARAGWAHGDIKPGNIMLTGSMAGAAAPCVLIDFGAAKPTGESLEEFSEYGLEHEPVASLAYDLACLATTLALLQYDLPLNVGKGTGAELLAELEKQDGVTWQTAGEPRPPGSLAAELCLQLSYRARSCRTGLDLGELRAAAETVASAAHAAELRVPNVADVWGDGGRE